MLYHKFYTNLQRDKKSQKTFLRKRGQAFCIDFLLIGMINKAIIFTYVNFVKNNFFYIPHAKQVSFLGNLHQLHLPTLFCVYWSYYIISLYLGNGQTPGKIALHLRIVDKNFGPHLTLPECVMRTLGYFITTITGFFLLALPYFTKDARGIPDWISKTRVFTKEELKSFHLRDDHYVQLDLFEDVSRQKNNKFKITYPQNEDEDEDEDENENENENYLKAA